MTAIAEMHIHKSMMKTKAMVTASSFPQHIVSKNQSTTPLHSSAQINLQARLFNSNVVKTAMTGIMADIGAALGIQDNTLKQKKRLRASDYTTETASAKKSPVHTEVVLSDTQPQNAHSVIEIARRKEDCSEIDENSLDSESYLSQLADFYSENSADEDNIPGFSAGIENTKRSRSEEASISSLQSPLHSAPGSSQFHPRKKSAPVPKSTTFIPSLALGGYISDSDSGKSLVFDSQHADFKARKNRRGQQERRQIWEKKFGQNANHVKNQLHRRSRDERWDPRSGARENNKGIYKKGRNSNFKKISVNGRGGPKSSGANSDPVRAKPKPKDKEEVIKPLHPSWEAARKVKAAKKNVTFVGKKVVFD